MSAPVIDRSSYKRPEHSGTDQICPLCRMPVEIQHTWCYLDGAVAHDYCVRVRYGR